MEVAAAKALGAGLAVIALAGVGIGIGNIFSAMVTSVARNPSARDAVFPIGILGFALTEAVALFALLIAFLILFTLIDLTSWWNAKRHSTLRVSSLRQVGAL